MVVHILGHDNAVTSERAARSTKQPENSLAPVYLQHKRTHTSTPLVSLVAVEQNERALTSNLLFFLVCSGDGGDGVRGVVHCEQRDFRQRCRALQRAPAFARGAALPHGRRQAGAHAGVQGRVESRDLIFLRRITCTADPIYQRRQQHFHLVALWGKKGLVHAHLQWAARNSRGSSLHVHDVPQ